MTTALADKHQFVIGVTCYWHHEWEVCSKCGRPDKPDDPQLDCHTHHNEDLNCLRMLIHPAHLEHVKMKAERLRRG